MRTTSFIELSESALKSNIDFIKKTLGKKCNMSSVIKGNAYGHGIKEFLPMSERCGLNHFSVFSTHEAYDAIECKSKSSQLMIMGMIDLEELEWVISNEIEFFIFTKERLDRTIKVCKKLQKKARVHIELETGLNRTGFNKGDLEYVCNQIVSNPDFFSIEGVCTHYAGAESIANYVRIQKQIRKFENMSKWMVGEGIIPIKKHTACSAAAMSYPRTRMDMARIGIMQYGYWSSRETFITYLAKRASKKDPLKRVISWKSQIMSTQKVNAGEFIGYGTTYMAESDMRIALVPVGYSQGYSRSLSNQGRLLIGGHRVGVVGVVNMNMMIADISSIPNVHEGDEVVLIGTQGSTEISVSSFSELSDQLNYELLTRLPQDIPRFITK